MARRKYDVEVIAMVQCSTTVEVEVDMDDYPDEAKAEEAVVREVENRLPWLPIKEDWIPMDPRGTDRTNWPHLNAVNIDVWTDEGQPDPPED